MVRKALNTPTYIDTKINKKAAKQVKRRGGDPDEDEVKGEEEEEEEEDEEVEGGTKGQRQGQGEGEEEQNYPLTKDNRRDNTNNYDNNIEIDDNIKNIANGAIEDTAPRQGGKSSASSTKPPSTSVIMNKIKEIKTIANSVDIKSHKKELKKAFKSIKKTLNTKPISNFLANGFSNSNKTKKQSIGGKPAKKSRRKAPKKKGGSLIYSEYNSTDTTIPQKDLPEETKTLSNAISVKQ
jgi:hypothetical protein